MINSLNKAKILNFVLGHGLRLRAPGILHIRMKTENKHTHSIQNNAKFIQAIKMDEITIFKRRSERIISI